MRTSTLAIAGVAVLLILSGIVGAVGPTVTAQTDTETDAPTDTETDQPTDRATDRPADAATHPDIDRWGHLQAALSLSDERIEELQAIAQEERENGASKQEVRRAVVDALADDGFDPVEIKLRLVTYRVGLHYELGDDQMSELLTNVSTNHDDGMSPREVMKETFATLEGWGYDTTEVKQYLKDRVDDRRKHAAVHKRIQHLQERYDLTDEQARLIHEEVHRMHEAGKSAEEIKQRVAAMIERFTGHEVDTGRDTLERYLDHLQYRYHLTADEVNDLRHLAEELHEDGHSKAEIKEQLRRTAAAMEG